MALRIEDYAMIGDMRSAALVGRDGAIDWLCWPHFDNGACFAALLGTDEHGSWRIAPDGGAKWRSSRRYRDGTMLLDTTFHLEGGGEVTVTDCMPVREDCPPTLLRVVTGRRGTVPMCLECVIRFDYGRSVPWVTRLPGGGGIRAVAGPDMVVLHSPVPLRGEGMHTVGRFEVAEGQSLAFEMAYVPSHCPLPDRCDEPHVVLAEDEARWRDWSGRVHAAGPWTDAVRRSAHRRGAQLGRPLLLAARRDLDPARPAAGRA